MIDNLLYEILKIFFASITSKTLLIIVAESVDIFFPIFQLGCLIACFKLTFFSLLSGLFKNGPPDAVM